MYSCIHSILVNSRVGTKYVSTGRYSSNLWRLLNYLKNELALQPVKCNQLYTGILLSSLWVSRTGSASDWCALQEALYKCIDTQRRQSGLITGGVVEPGENISIFSCNFTNIIDSSRQISEKFRLFKIILPKTSIFQGKFPTNFEFLGNFSNNFDFFRQLKKFVFKNFDFWGNLKKIRFSRKISIFYRQFHTKNRFFRANFRKISIIF